MATLSSILSRPVFAVAPTSYTTAVLVAAILGGEVGPEQVMPEWLAQAVQEIDLRTGMCFTAKEFESELDGDETNKIFLDTYPIIEVFSVELEGEQIPPWAYKVNKRTGVITLLDDLTPIGTANVVVQGIRGHNLVPPIVQKIATLIVAKTVLSARFGPLIDNEHIGDFSQTRTFKKLNDELDRAWDALGRNFRIYTL